MRFKSGGYIIPLTSTAFNSKDKDQVSRDFLGRTSLNGQIANGDCSLKIERISQDDSRMFEVALKTGEDLLWGKPKSFNLDVIREYCPLSTPIEVIWINVSIVKELNCNRVF